MSILIKGLQLPKSSSNQTTEIIGFSGAVYLYPNGEAKIRITTSPYHTQSYSIIEVPPHGSLIDVEGGWSVNITNMPGGKCNVDVTAPAVIPADKEVGDV